MGRDVAAAGRLTFINRLQIMGSGKMGGTAADPGQDPRGAPGLMPLWTLFDSTPVG
jgi:hypothetical protein